VRSRAGTRRHPASIVVTGWSDRRLALAVDEDVKQDDAFASGITATASDWAVGGSIARRRNSALKNTAPDNQRPGTSGCTSISAP
jgi:hypothetical protein